MNGPMGGTTLTVFRITLVLVIFIESVMTVVHSMHSTTESHLGAVVPWFAGVEAIAAVGLLIPRTVTVSGGVLLVIFTLALIVHGPAGQMALFVYAAAVVLLMANGSASAGGVARSNTGDAREEEGV